MELTERDREILSQAFETWAEADSPLAGDLSYADVFALCDKLGVPRPAALVRFCAWAEREAKS